MSVNWGAFTSSHSTRSKPQRPNTAAAILHRWCHLEPESAHPLLQSPASLSCRWNIFIAVDSAQTNACEIRTTQKGNRYWISFRAMSSPFLPYVSSHPSSFTLIAFKISKSCAAFRRTSRLQLLFHQQHMLLNPPASERTRTSFVLSFDIRATVQSLQLRNVVFCSGHFLNHYLQICIFSTFSF